MGSNKAEGNGLSVLSKRSAHVLSVCVLGEPRLERQMSTIRMSGTGGWRGPSGRELTALEGDVSPVPDTHAG